MRTRGRRSAESLAINAVDGTPARLTAPAGLTTKERALFLQLVNACSPNHLRAADTPLLITYVQAALLARELGRDPKKTREWERAARTMAALAVRLRLTPQSRKRPETIARQRQNGIAPWHATSPECDEDDEEWPRTAVADKKDLQ
jgi:hypothetical protein